MDNNQKRAYILVPQEPGLPATGPFSYQYLASEGERPGRNKFWKYYHILLRRKRWVLGVSLAVVMIWGLVIFLQTPVFQASSLVQITSDNAGSLVNSKESVGNLFSGEGRQEFFQTQFNILKSRSLAQRVVERLKLQENARFNPDTAAAPSEAATKKLVDKFIKSLSVSPERNSYLVRVAFESEDPALAQQVTNTLIQEYVQFGMESRSQAFGAVQKWLNQQLQDLRAKVESSEKELYSFSEQSDVINPESQGNVVMQKFSDISSLLTKAESDRMAKEAQFKQIHEGGLNSPAILNNQLIMQLRQELSAQEAKVARMNRIYLDGHPEMQAEQAKLGRLRARLNEEVKQLGQSIKADYEAAKRAEDLLRQNLTQQKDQVSKLQRKTVEYKILKRDVETNEALYKGLLSRMKEASIASTMVPTNVLVIDPAERPESPLRPKKALNLLLALMAGAFGGVGLAFLLDHLDGSIKDVEDFEHTGQIPTLGLVPALPGPTAKYLPDYANSPGTRVTYLEQYDSEMSEAIRHLRTAILFSRSEDAPHVLLITSPHPQEGKTTIAVNLACSLAQQGLKVVLVDVDLRRPQLHRVFNKPISPGLSDFLNNHRGSDQQVVHPCDVPNLSVITAGSFTSNPAELVGSETLKDFLATLRQTYDYVILDSPPVLGFAEGVILSAFADGVIVVVKQFHTPMLSGLQTLNLLQKVRAPVIGTIVNYVDFKTCPYAYYYRYYSSYNQYKPNHDA